MFDGFMRKEYCLNKKAAEITGARPRQIQAWSDKRIIKPKKGGKGLGHKRGYDVVNLYEIRLVKTMMEQMSQPVHLIKDILDGLRENDMLRLWATNQKEYFEKAFERMVPNYKETHFRDDKDQARWEHVFSHFHKFFIKSPLLTKQANGVLYSFFGSEIKQKYWILPVIYSITDYEATIAMEILHFYSRIYDQALFVNLGKIKDYIDRKIELNN